MDTIRARREWTERPPTDRLAPGWQPYLSATAQRRRAPTRTWREGKAPAPRLALVAHPARPAAAPTAIRSARAVRRRQRRDGFHWGPFLRRRAINAGRMLIAVPCGWIIGAFLCAVLGR